LIEAGNSPGRRSQAQWLVYTGLRIEADECRVMDVHLASDPRLKPHLLAHLDGMKRRGLYSPTTPILHTRHGTVVKEQQAHRQLVEMGERAGLAKKVSPQTLRRTYGSLLLNATLSDTRVRFPPPPLLQ